MLAALWTLLWYVLMLCYLLDILLGECGEGGGWSGQIFTAFYVGIQYCNDRFTFELWLNTTVIDVACPISSV